MVGWGALILFSLGVAYFVLFIKPKPVAPALPPRLAPAEEQFEWRGARICRFAGGAAPPGEDTGAPALSGIQHHTHLMAELSVSLPGRVVVLRDILLPDFHSRNLHDVRVGDPPFDSLFLVEQEWPGLAQVVLTAPVRSALVGLRGALVRYGDTANAGVALTLGQSRLWLSIPETRDLDVLDWAYAAARAVVDALLDPRTTDAPESETAVVGVSLSRKGGVCLVCATEVGQAAVVRCRACRTPHHAECFRYVGRCAVFGCGCGESEFAGP